MMARFCKLLASLSLALALSACGGDGGGGSVASTPPPVAPTAPAAAAPAIFQIGQEYTVGARLQPTPALTNGTYDVLGIVATTDGAGRIANTRPTPSDLRIAVDTATKTYTLLFDPAVFPGLTAPGVLAGKLAYVIESPLYGHEFSQTLKYSDGTVKTLDGYKGEVDEVNRGPERNGDPRYTSYRSDIGKRYVSLGRWTLFDGPVTQQIILFAYGERTQPAALPASGTAQYQFNDIEFGNGTDIKLTTDFSRRSIAADLLNVWDDALSSNGWFTLTGSGLIDRQGAFEIPLTGTSSAAPTLATGSLGGAFFGPDASQIGGYWQASNGFTGSFVAVKQ